MDIRANTTLPAERRRIELRTEDGLTLVGELARPHGEPRGAVVCLHPLPTHGGSMNSHLFRKAAWRLPALAGIAVLRFNTRGTDGSEGAYDDGRGELADVAAALTAAVSDGLPTPWLVGWSFGTDLALLYGATDERIAGAVLLAPPLKKAGEAHLAAWGATGKPLVAVIPEFDDYLRPDAARARFSYAEIVEIPEAKHLFVGFAEEVLDVIAERVVPGSAPLPRTWEGPPS